MAAVVVHVVDPGVRARPEIAPSNFRMPGDLCPARPVTLKEPHLREVVTSKWPGPFAPTDVSGV
jgi:hypothetical protein